MNILGIDPGPVGSAFARLDGTSIELTVTVENEGARVLLRQLIRDVPDLHIVIEDIKAYGVRHWGKGAQRVTQEAIETAVWIGIFLDVAWTEGCGCIRVARPTVVAHFTGLANAKKASVKEALIERYGPPTFKLAVPKKWKDEKTGRWHKRKTEDGPTKGIDGHSWDALAVATWFKETR